MESRADRAATELHSKIMRNWKWLVELEQRGPEPDQDPSSYFEPQWITPPKEKHEYRVRELKRELVLDIIELIGLKVTHDISKAIDDRMEMMRHLWQLADYSKYSLDHFLDMLLNRFRSGFPEVG
jgi:hypothetical protein